MDHPPSTLDTFGVKTGVTRISLPTRNWRSTANNSGSFGNSQKSARTGGVPLNEALANSEYYTFTKVISDAPR
jgi:hypothetical protein